MHPCLYITEIQSVILQSLRKHAGTHRTGQDPYTIPDAPSLLAAALTCRAFKDKALELLWSELPSPLPILWLFGDAWITHLVDDTETEEDTDDESEQMATSIRRMYDVDLLRPPTTEEWDTTSVRRSQVRHLDIVKRFHNMKLWISKEAVRRFVDTATEDVLPNLSSLRLVADGHVAYPTQHFLPLYCSAKLLSLELLINHHICELGFLDGMEVALRTVKSFTIYGRRRDWMADNWRATDRLSQAVVRCKNLQELVVPDLLKHARHRIARLPLRRLEIFASNQTFGLDIEDGISEDDVGMIEIHAEEHGSFPHLRMFYCDDSPRYARSDFLAHMEHSSIEALELRHIQGVQFDEGSSPAYWRDYTTAISNAVSYGSLRIAFLHAALYFSRQNEPQPLERPSLCPLGASGIIPLFQFSNLAFVCLSAYRIDLDDDLILGMAQAWPMLRMLDIRSEISNKDSCPPVFQDESLADRIPGITFASLFPLSQYCPELNHLVISVDTRNIQDTILILQRKYGDEFRKLPRALQPLTRSRFRPLLLETLYSVRPTSLDPQELVEIVLAVLPNACWDSDWFHISGPDYSVRENPCHGTQASRYLVTRILFGYILDSVPITGSIPWYLETGDSSQMSKSAAQEFDSLLSLETVKLNKQRQASRAASTLWQLGY